MKKQKKKRILWQQYVGMAFLLLVGAACGIVMVSYLEGLGGERLLHEELLILGGLFLGMYAALLLHMILHEAGHLIFGLLSGYGFSSFRIFSLMWVKEEGGVRLRRLSIAGTGGQCLMVPPAPKDGKIPLLLYNLGGSIVNAAVGAVLLVLYLIFPSVPFLSPLLMIFSLIGFASALLNGVPMRMGTVDNDGYNAFALSKNKEAVFAFWVQLKVNEQISKGVRLKDMPEEWFAFPSDEAMKNSMVAARAVFACNRLMDAGLFAETEERIAHLLSIESGIVDLHRGLLVCDRMFIELIGSCRAEVLQPMRTREQEKIMKAMKRFPSVLRTEYAFALLFEKNEEKAEKIKKDFEKAAKTYPYPSEIGAERALLALAENAAKEVQL